MIQNIFVEKYEGRYKKEFQTKEEQEEWINEHFEITAAFELIDNEWVQV